ncbi:hypothetical protein Q3G72_001148 [Acer saccharum]|nr:hypothetical protein Q3G72_001148 [Acer saccharum]
MRFQSRWGSTKTIWTMIRCPHMRRSLLKEFFGRLCWWEFKTSGLKSLRIGSRLLTSLRYSNKKKRPAPSSSPTGSPIIGPNAGELRAVMEMTMREYEERTKAKLDPKGKGTSFKAKAESSDED